jgi:hypothetical protein
MAERVVRQLVDDIDGTDITDGKGESIEFSVRGERYRIDLSAQNVTKFDKALTPYLRAATKMSSPRAASRKPTPGKRARRAPKVALAQVRQWASENGYEVSPRGRIAAGIVEAYEAAHAS